jgi:hypothetical protein
MKLTTLDTFVVTALATDIVSDIVVVVPIDCSKQPQFQAFVSFRCDLSIRVVSTFKRSGSSQFIGLFQEVPTFRREATMMMGGHPPQHYDCTAIDSDDNETLDTPNAFPHSCVLTCRHSFPLG